MTTFLPLGPALSVQKTRKTFVLWVSFDAPAIRLGEFVTLEQAMTAATEWRRNNA